MEEIWERTSMLRIYTKVSLLISRIIGNYNHYYHLHFFFFKSSQKDRFLIMTNQLFYMPKILRLRSSVTDCIEIYSQTFHMLGSVSTVVFHFILFVTFLINQFLFVNNSFFKGEEVPNINLNVVGEIMSCVMKMSYKFAKRYSLVSSFIQNYK